MLRIRGMRKAKPSVSKTKDVPVLVKLSTVKPSAITWVRPRTWPRGKLSIVAGDPGLGKSFLALDAAARISRGTEWPEGGKAPRGNVVILTAEDALSDTVRPRLDAMGADAKKIIALQAIKSGDGQERLPALKGDLPILEGVVQKHRPALVIIDPLSAYLGNASPSVRGLLAQVARLAERYKTAVVAVMHLNKSSAKGLYRVSGSVAFTAAARSVFLVAQGHPTPEANASHSDGEAKPAASGPRTYFGAVKMNLAAHPPVLAFCIKQNGKGAVIEWENAPVDVNLEAVLTAQAETSDERHERLAAKDWLKEVLTAAGGSLTVDVIKQHANDVEMSWSSIRRAKQLLGVKSERTGWGAWGHWKWSLPAPRDHAGH